MASLIKNQILKHLSKFAKNLSPDKLHLSTLKGHGELHNLELNEQVLTELLELPAWLRLTRATCNHVTLKIHWTKLKSVPIYLSLDEVIVEMETCEDLRPPTPLSNDMNYNTSGKYGFSDRVIDGMTVVVNSILINFRSPAFQASFQLQRVVLESYSPDWKKKDLRLSRIKDPERGEVLLFKRLEWQVLRIEAKSKDSTDNQKSDIPITPLRLITNQACCKMTIKKKLGDISQFLGSLDSGSPSFDCSVVGSRLVFVLDDLLWVLTDAQLVAALHFLQSLSGLVQKATQMTQKQKAKQKLEFTVATVKFCKPKHLFVCLKSHHQIINQQPEKPQSSSHARSSIRLSPVFTRHDVVETSYHVLCSRIDLHLCDDMDPKDGRSQHPNLKDGGALQVSLNKLVVDYYPYHRAFGSREHWLRYSEPSSSRSAWVQQLLSMFYEKVQNKTNVLLSMDGVYPRVESPKHTAVHRAPPHGSPNVYNSKIENTGPGSPTSPDEKPGLTRKGSSGSTGNPEGTTPDTGRKNLSNIGRKSSIQWNYRYLMSSCFVLRLEDFVAYKVSTSTSSRKHAIGKFLMYNKNAHLPSEIKTIHLEQTSYYLPGDLDFPVPSSNLFLHFGPLKLSLDAPTVLWLNAFHLNLQKCLMSMKSDNVETPSLVNIRIEALMPQIVIPTDPKSPTQPDRPTSLQLQASRIIATNCRLGDHASHVHLSNCLESMTPDTMFFNTDQFPWERGDKKPVSERFVQHILESASNPEPTKTAAVPKEIISECSDVWSIHLDPFWSDFTICEAGRTRLQSFIDPLPLTLWFYNSQKAQLEEDSPKSSSSAQDIKCLDKKEMYLPKLQSYLCQTTDMPKTIPDTKDLNAKSAEEKDETDIYLLLHVHSMLNIQLSHFQYLFVLRTIDIVSDMLENLTLDTTAILKDKPVVSACVTAWWPKVEIALVLRSLNQMSATSDSVDLASLQEDCSSNSEIHLSSCKKGMLQSQSSYSVGECDTVSKHEQSDKLCSGILDDCCIENGFPKSCSDSLLNCHSSASSPTSNALASEMQSSSEVTTESLHKGLQSGTSAVKRGFCSLVASIDSALTKSEAHNTNDVENTSYQEEDAMSIRSDISSDLDQFVLVNQDGALEDEFFPHPEAELGIDAATEMKDDTISNYTLNSEKKKEMVSVTIFKLSGLGFTLQTKISSCVMMQCKHIETKEEAAISWENFQNNFSSRSRSWQTEKKQPQAENCELSLRIVADPSSAQSPQNQGFLKMFASDLRLQLLMSSVSGLVDFFEDETPPKPMPAKIILDNLLIHLQEDRPLSEEASPSSAPLVLSLPGCILQRTIDGKISVLPLQLGYVKKNLNSVLSDTFPESSGLTVRDNRTQGTGSEPHGATVQGGAHHVNSLDTVHTSSSSCDKSQFQTPLVVSLLAENERLRSKVTEMEDLRQENQSLKEELLSLKTSVNELQLKKRLEESANEITRLEGEKRTLHETLRVLQEELSRIEKERIKESLK